MNKSKFMFSQPQSLPSIYLSIICLSSIYSLWWVLVYLQCMEMPFSPNTCQHYHHFSNSCNLRDKHVCTVFNLTSLNEHVMLNIISIGIFLFYDLSVILTSCLLHLLFFPLKLIYRAIYLLRITLYYLFAIFIFEFYSL